MRERVRPWPYAAAVVRSLPSREEVGEEDGDETDERRG